MDAAVGKTGAVIHLAESPRLVWPTTAVRTSYLVGEQADCLFRGTPTEWLGPASGDSDGFVAVRRGVQTRWGVPSTVFWYVSGEYYLGTLVVRHEVTRSSPARFHVTFKRLKRSGCGRANFDLLRARVLQPT